MDFLKIWPAYHQAAAPYLNSFDCMHAQIASKQRLVANHGSKLPFYATRAISGRMQSVIAKTEQPSVRAVFQHVDTVQSHVQTTN